MKYTETDEVYGRMVNIKLPDAETWEKLNDLLYKCKVNTEERVVKLKQQINLVKEYQMKDRG